MTSRLEDWLCPARKAKRLALIAHVSPDGDTVGATLALRLAFLAMGKAVDVICDGEPPKSMDFLSGIDAFIHPEICTNIRATAKELKVPEKMFTAFLIRKRYLYRAPSGSLMPYAKAADDGLFFVKDYIAVNGHQGVYTLVTPKGKALFLSMLGEIA